SDFGASRFGPAPTTSILYYLHLFAKGGQNRRSLGQLPYCPRQREHQPHQLRLTACAGLGKHSLQMETRSLKRRMHPVSGFADLKSLQQQVGKSRFCRRQSIELAEDSSTRCRFERRIRQEHQHPWTLFENQFTRYEWKRCQLQGLFV